jgi:alkanesulfonate monooxygenase SsuD/methylene tetrahydromethanopterin reductase-like flavin-dependent oxidoreductase (luciferase family)
MRKRPKLGLNVNIKAREINYEVFRQYLEIARRADEAGIYYLAFPSFFARPDPIRLHVVPYMAAIASHTTYAKLGTDILQIPLLHPIHIADICSSLDIISNGRFVLGAGVGYFPSEYENFGVPFNERGSRTDEALEIIKRLWTETSVTYQGKYFNLKDVVCIKPVQEPHPPIWIGGNSDAALKRVAKYGNEWASTFWATEALGVKGKWNIKERIEKLRAYCKRFGRKLVLSREPRTFKEVGFNIRIEVNVNRNEENALKEIYKFMELRRGYTRGGGQIEERLRYMAFGTAENVIEKLKKIYELGAYLIILYPATLDMKSQWERIEREILPCL